MKTILKRTLNVRESNTVELPLSAAILSIKAQGDKIALYYGIADTEEQETISYDFRIYGTGQRISVGIRDYIFLGTVKMYDNGLILHVFCKQIVL